MGNKVYNFQEFVDLRGSKFTELRNIKIGDIVSSDVIYNYVQQLHNMQDFIDGDIGERIENYSSYKYMELPIDQIENPFMSDDYLKDVIVETGWYPPIVLNSDLEIIDGAHRYESLYDLGYKSVKCFVGIE